MNALALARRGWSTARGLRRLVAPPRHRWTRPSARSPTRCRTGGDRFLRMLDELVWPYPASPTRRLLDHAGVEAGDAAGLVDELGLDGALERPARRRRLRRLRGVPGPAGGPAGQRHVHVRAGRLLQPGRAGRLHGRPPAAPAARARRWSCRSRGSAARASSGRSSTTWPASAGAPTAVWLPVFPSAAGFGAVMKISAGGNRPERWFSQIPGRLEGVAGHKQAANRLLPALSVLTRTGLPSPEHVPGDEPEPVVALDARRAATAPGGPTITGYASSITAAARWAVEHGIDLTGVVAYPASEPVTAGKLAAMRAVGHAALPDVRLRARGHRRPWPATAATTRSTTSGTRSSRSSPAAGRAATAPRSTPSASRASPPIAPRVLVNVENDDYGEVRRDVDCDCALGRLGLRTRVGAHPRHQQGRRRRRHARGRDVRRARRAAAARPASAAAPATTSSSRRTAPTGTPMALRIHPRVGDVDEDAALGAVARRPGRHRQRAPRRRRCGDRGGCGSSGAPLVDEGGEAARLRAASPADRFLDCARRGTLQSAPDDEPSDRLRSSMACSGRRLSPSPRAVTTTSACGRRRRPTRHGGTAAGDGGEPDAARR